MLRTWLMIAAPLALFAAIARADEPFSPTPTPFPWTTDGVVERFVQDGDRLYITGKFRLVGRPSGTSARVDIATATSNAWPVANGTVTAVEPDGNGGVYISGAFDRVGGLVRKQFAHVLADGSVGPLVLETQGAAKDILVLDGVIYVGGYGGWGKNSQVERYGLAAFDESTGLLLPWDPFPTHFDKPGSGEGFECFAVRGSELLVGGKFDCLFDTIHQRKNFVALDLATAAASAWNPAPDDTILDFADVGSALVVAGNFNVFDGQLRSKVAIVDPATQALDPFAATFSSTVFDVAVSGSTVYVGGLFTAVNGVSRGRAAALDLSAQLLAFDPQLTGGDGDGPQVESLAVDGTHVYLGGCFANVGADRRWCLAQVDPVSGAATPWVCHVGGPEASHVSELAVSNGELLLGGNFTMVEGQQRLSLATIDLATDELDGLAPRFEFKNFPDEPGGALDVTPFGDRLIVSGSFYSVDGTPRPKLAAVDRTTGALVPTFDAGIGQSDNGAFDVEVVNDVLYLSNRGGANDLAALDPWTGATLDMGLNEIETANWVRTLETSADGNTLYFGGQFDSVTTGISPDTLTSSRGYGASIETGTHALQAWNPQLNAKVTSLVRAGDSLYAGGDFEWSGLDTSQGVTRMRVCEFDVASGLLTPFAPSIETNSVTALAVSGKYLFVGGTFAKINGVSHPRLAAIDRATGLPASWTPQFSGSITTMIVANDRLFVGCSTGFLQFADNVLAAMGVFRIDSLTSPTTTISLATGGSQVLNVHAGYEHAGESFWMLGSASGTSPEFDLAGVRVPLALDAYTMFTASTPFFVFIGNPGALDDYGDGTTSFVLPAGLSPALAGLTIHHAAVVYDAGVGVPTFATAPLGVKLTP